MAKFPKKLFVKIERDNDDHWFMATEGVEGMVNVGEKERVGVYELKEYVIVDGVARSGIKGCLTRGSPI